MIYNNPLEKRIYTCSNCGQMFKQGSMVCAVLHYGSGCCHYGDTPLFDNKKAEDKHVGMSGELLSIKKTYKILIDSSNSESCFAKKVRKI